MFKVGDRIVLLRGPEHDSEWCKHNHIYHLGHTGDMNVAYCTPDSREGSIGTAASKVRFDQPNSWRYAMQHEIQEYNKTGKPFDVGTLIRKDTVTEYQIY